MKHERERETRDEREERKPGERTAAWLFSLSSSCCAVPVVVSDVKLMRVRMERRRGKKEKREKKSTSADPQQEKEEEE